MGFANPFVFVLQKKKIMGQLVAEEIMTMP